MMNELDMTEDALYKKKRLVTLIGTLVNLLLMLLQYTIGYMVGSGALIADATHTATDYISDIIVLIGIKLASKPADKEHPYGHGKFETVASLVVAFLIASAGGFIFYEGINKFLNMLEGEGVGFGEDYVYAVYIAILTIIAKEGLYRYTRYYGNKLNSLALLSNASHHRTDSISSIGVLIGILSTLYLGLLYMDSIATMFVAGFILYAAFEIFYKAFEEMVDTAPPEKIRNRLESIANDTIGVKSSKSIRSRTIGGRLITDMTIEVEATFTLYEAYQIGESVKKNIRKNISSVLDVVIHLEPSEQTSEIALERQSKIEKILSKTLNMYSNTLTGVRDIRYYHLNKRVDIMVTFTTNKDLLSREEKVLIDLIKGVLAESDPEINNIYISLQYESPNK